jgi:sulfoxide reductase heme-binding subunit YedZ
MASKIFRLSTALKPAVFVLCLTPLAYLIGRAVMMRLGANPIEEVLHRTGDWTLIFLLITLGVTPVRLLTGWGWVGGLRRMLGLFAFFYACLHFSIYVGVDQFFDLESIYKDVVKRKYITIGFTGFVLLIPLAVTSTNAAVRRLGAKRWQALHRLVYVTAVCGVVHYWWLVKKDIRTPLLYATILAVLLGVRLVRARGSRRPAASTAGLAGG